MSDKRPDTRHSIGAKLAVGGVAAGLLLAGWSLLFRDDPPAPATPAPVTSVNALDSSYGFKPLDEVVAVWRTKSDAAPNDHISRAHLASALSSQAREQADLDLYAEAEEAAAESLALKPDYNPARLALASARAAQHDFVTALDLATQVYDSDPRALSALALVGDAHLELGNYDEASAIYRELAGIERSAPIVSRLAKLTWLQGDNQGAVSLATEAAETSEGLALRASSQAFYWFQLGHFRYEAGQIDAAVEALEKALEISPGHPGASEKLAEVYTAQRRYDDAIALYEQLTAGGGAADLHVKLGTLYDLTGQAERGADELRTGLDLVPWTIETYPAEHRHLIGFLVDHDPATALELAEADAAVRHDAHGRDLLAWALHANGRSDEAVQYIDEALAVGIRDAAILYHAGAIHAAVGDTTTAIGHLEAALALNPHFHPIHGPKAEALLTELRADAAT